MKTKQLSISFEQYDTLTDFNDEDQSLCLRSEEVLKSSHSPYSGFRVGAALLLEGDLVIPGSNQENVAYPSGLCAERVAIFAAGAMHPDKRILRMAITAQTDHFAILDPVTSCGACLQVMVEYEKKQGSPIEIIFYCRGGQSLKIKSVQDLMPFAFAETRLKNN